MSHPIMEDMRELYMRMSRVMNETLRGQGASLAQVKLLNFIDRSRSVRAIDISEALVLAPRTVTEAIDALERDGLVRRDPDPRDRRAKRISLTEAGKDILCAVGPSADTLAVQLCAALTPGEQDDFLRMLRKLNARLSEMGAPNPYGDADAPDNVPPS